VPNVVGAARFLPVIEHVGFPRERTRIVLNHNFPRCPGGLTVADAEERLERPVDHVVRYDRRLVPALNTGRPRVLDASRLWGFGRSIRRIVEELEAVGPVGAERALDAHAAPPEPLPAANASPGSVESFDRRVPA
jgi:hypothetical protein